jgi:hypothetical protein
MAKFGELEPGRLAQSVGISQAQHRALFDAPDEPAICPEDWPGSLKRPTEFFLRAYRFFHRRCPQEVRDHRAYFEQGRRGFGDPSLHAMWFLLHERLHLRRFLEIGVFRGQVISLIALLHRLSGETSGVIAGISPFVAAQDSVSYYPVNIDYHEDTLLNFRNFDLPLPTLCRAYSTDSAAAELVRSTTWDAIFIDGNHEYEVARSDWSLCSAHVRPGGIIVLDDAGLYTTYVPPFSKFKGHPGPSRVAQEVDRQRFREILQIGHNRVFQRIAG